MEGSIIMEGHLQMHILLIFFHYCPTKIALKSQSFIGGIDKKLSSDLKG